MKTGTIHDSDMILNNRKKIIIINSLIIASLFGLVALNKEILRPLCSDASFASVLTGSFPNFIAAYLISLAIVSAMLIRKPKFGRQIVYAASFIVFAILTIEELMPMWGASTHYDSFDIFASGIGSLLAIFTFEFINFIQKKK